MQSALDFPFALLQELGFEIHLFLTSVAWPERLAVEYAMMMMTGYLESLEGSPPFILKALCAASGVANST